ncbi:ABC transporter ATP-binding protein [Leucobacter sp. wl10]|uniref:dipeptide ABC transporter ATP-binding protein n=1 Tax=Leucobacter sp. wl10 TaxID=2304677 RepID=UPI000E5A9934|nr:ABC transporter ATP-binding protein [Leucobacter sp. wl10]RGE22057.1 ABC transporter ATP-binding protein [Leucobacter sp. wl10]
MSKNLLSIAGLDVDYRVRERLLPALRDFEMDVREGEIVAIVGESGSGKSTAMSTMVGLLPENALQRGSILLQGEEVIGADDKVMRRIRGRRVGYVPQDPMTSLNPTKRVAAQVAESLLLHKLCTRSEAKAKVHELLRAAGLIDVERVALSFPHELSGGMRQRVLIAAAFAGDPDLIIADEPTSALDVTVSQQIMNHFEGLVRERGKALVLITHDLALATNRADRTIVMQQGRIVETGRSSEVLANSENPYTKLLASKNPQFLIEAIAEQEDDALAEAEEAEHTAPIVLRADRLFKNYRDRFDKSRQVEAVKDVSIEIRAGRTLALIGESGSGKTTTARLCLRLEDVSSGTIEFLGEDITHARGRRLREVRRDISVVYQSPFSSLDPLMSIQDIITEPLTVHGIGNRLSRQKRASELLDAVGLPDSFLKRRVTELSGGQRQRVGIARALASSPKLVVCDEPVSALDVVVQDQVMELLGELQREFGMAYLFISHDLALVSNFADEVAIINRGEIVEAGPSAAVFAAPRDPYTRRLLDAAINL